MSPEQQAARDAALVDADQLSAAVKEVIRQAYYLLDDTANGGEIDQEVDPQSWNSLSAAMDALEALVPAEMEPCLPSAAVDLLRTTPPPPPAAPGEITQEQAREMREALCKAAAQFEYYGMQHAAKGTAEAHAKAKTNCDMADMCRAALAGVPAR